MKRSENVGLVMMGGAAFAATFAVGMAYYAWQKPRNAAQPQAAAAAQNCTTRPDGTQSCEPARRGFGYYLLPSFMYGAAASTAEPKRPHSAPLTSNADPKRPQSAALTSNARASTPSVSPSGTTRGGFGGTAQSTSFRPSAGG